MAGFATFGLPPLGSNVPTPPPLPPLRLAQVASPSGMIQVQPPSGMAAPNLPKPPSIGGQDQSNQRQMMQQAAMGGLGDLMMRQMFPPPANPYMAESQPPIPDVASIGAGTTAPATKTASPSMAGAASATSTSSDGTTDYRALATQYADQYGIPTDFFTRLIDQESGFNPNARSPAGAIGIAQIMPQTAQGWGVDPTDPKAALNAAAKNLKAYADANGGSWLAAAISYNAGPGAWTTYQRTGWLPDETKRYVQTILGITV